MRSIPARLVLMAATLFSLLASPLGAAKLVSAASLTFVVNSNQDAHDLTVGDGLCATNTGTCTIRAAIEEANAQTIGSTITISVPAGSYVLTLGVLAITGNTVAVNGAGQSSTVIAANRKSQVLSVAKSTRVTVTRLTIKGGNAGPAKGGAIANRGYTNLNGTTITASTSAQGGGIWNQGTLIVSNSTISGNSTNVGRTGTKDRKSVV